MLVCWIEGGREIGQDDASNVMRSALEKKRAMASNSKLWIVTVPGAGESKGGRWNW